MNCGALRAGGELASLSTLTLCSPLVVYFQSPALIRSPVAHSPFVAHKRGSSFLALASRSLWHHLLPLFPHHAPATRVLHGNRLCPSCYHTFTFPVPSVWNSLSDLFLFESYSSSEAVGAAPLPRSLILTTPLSPSRPPQVRQRKGCSAHYRITSDGLASSLCLLSGRGLNPAVCFMFIPVLQARDYCFPFCRLKKKKDEAQKEIYPRSCCSGDP